MITPIWVSQTISDFGRMLGFDELCLNDSGALQIAIENLGVLGLEEIDDGLLAYLMRPLARGDVRVYRRALQMCRTDNSPLDWLQASLLEKNQLIFATRLKSADIQLPLLETTLTTLSVLHDTVACESE